MRIAWFRPAGAAAEDDSDYMAAVIAALGAHHAIAHVDERGAHDFVWQHARGHFDLCVYELDNTARHQYMWAYLLNYPGVLALQSATVHDARRARLVHEGRQADYRAEIAFAGGPTQTRPPWHMARGQWPMLRIPVLGSRLTAVADAALAEELMTAMPDARIRVVAAGVAQPDAGPVARVQRTSAPVTVMAAEPARHAVVERAVARVSAGGVPIVLDQTLREVDIVVAVQWPTSGRPPVAALRAMAAGRPTVVAETRATADWPALDPQTWRQRDRPPVSEAPIVVSVDPRDEEHSLVLALQRLAGDAALRSELGGAARAWWATHATPGHAVTSWQSVLAEAAATPITPRPADWPSHLTADGSWLTRRILKECGIDGLRQAATIT